MIHYHVWPWTKKLGERWLIPNWLAVTFGHHIISWRPLTPREQRHERKHVEQWDRHGLLFIWRYHQASEAARRAGQHPYWANVFEVEARSAE